MPFDVGLLRREITVRVLDPASRRAIENRHVAEVYWYLRSRRKGYLRARVERRLLANPRFAEFYWRERRAAHYRANEPSETDDQLPG